MHGAEVARHVIAAVFTLWKVDHQMAPGILGRVILVNLGILLSVVVIALLRFAHAHVVRAVRIVAVD